MTTIERDRARASSRPRLGRHQALAVVVAAALVAVTHVVARHTAVFLGGAAPLLGALNPRISLDILPVLAVAAVGVGWLPRAAARVSWRRLLVGTWAAALAWGLALAFTDGLHGITHPLTTADEYLPDLRHVHGFASYVSGFTAHVHDPAAGQFLWSTHVSGGPPGPLLLFAGLAHIGLGGAGWAALLVAVVGTAAAPAALVTARCVVDEATARRAAPFVALAPFAIWIVSSADALFLGMSAWGVALLSVAATRTGRRADLAALAGGLVLGAALYCSYGVAPLGLVVIAVVACRRRVRPLVVGAVGVAVVAVFFAGFGFWWWDGLTATRVRYAEGIATMRPYAYFLFADVAAFALSLGPAAIAGLASLRRSSRLWWLVGAALAAAAVSDLSGLSKGEVERIWLPFAIWPLLAAVAVGGVRARRSWLVVQVVFAVVLQSVLVSNW